MQTSYGYQVNQLVVLGICCFAGVITVIVFMNDGIVANLLTVLN